MKGTECNDLNVIRIQKMLDNGKAESGRVRKSVGERGEGRGKGG